MVPPHQFHGLEIAVRSFSGARGLRIVHPAGQLIPAHRHEWPLLTLPALGGYREEADEGVTEIAGPAVVLHPAGRCHANCIHDRGMETFSIEFDPAWVRVSPALLERTRYWVGGSVPLRARAMLRVWLDPGAGECAIRAATRNFLKKALDSGEDPQPHWLPAARRQLATSAQTTARSIAEHLDLNPRWLAHAYRSAAGEGLQDTVARMRCEQAANQLRSTAAPIAAVAAECGFCDQSHLNRVLKRLTGRTPAQIRAEGALLSRLATS